MKYADEINFSDDTIDSRDVERRIDWLVIEIEDYENDIAGFREDDEEVPEKLLDELEELNEELEILNDFKNEADSPEWDDGLLFINRDYWVEYVEELIAEIGDMPRELPLYISNNIDWKGVADDIEADYSSIDVGKEEFLYRNY